MKILVIPDVHGRKFWRKAIADNVNQVEKIIFLGDYLDPYPREIKENPDLMECADFYDSKGLLTMLNDIVSLKKNEPDILTHIYGLNFTLQKELIIDIGKTIISFFHKI